METHIEGKLHKLLRQLLLIFLIITMILNPVNSRNCNGVVRTIQLFSGFTKGFVRIEGKKVVANMSNDKYESEILQMITIDRHYFLIYDPNAKMFICWNKGYTNLLAKRNPKNLSFCKFEEKTSIKHPAGKTRYTTTYIKGSKHTEVELRFRKSGAFAVPISIKRCLEKRKRLRGKDQIRHHYKTDLELMTNIDTLNINPETKRAYVQLSKCADSDFIVDNLPIDCSLGYSNFCEQMKRIHHRHPVVYELQNLCNL